MAVPKASPPLTATYTLHSSELVCLAVTLSPLPPHPTAQLAHATPPDARASPSLAMHPRPLFEDKRRQHVGMCQHRRGMLYRSLMAASLASPSMTPPFGGSWWHCTKRVDHLWHSQSHPHQPRGRKGANHQRPQPDAAPQSWRPAHSQHDPGKQEPICSMHPLSHQAP